jgi:drug/metabolite transporter (DMT)-like permease
MYCLSILLSFFGYVILVRASSTIAMQVAVGIAGIALLIGAATLMTWTAKRDRPGPKLF